MADVAMRILSRGGAAAVVAGIIGEFCMYDVDGGTRAVIFHKLRGGTQDKVIGEGTHFLIPGIEEAIIIDIRDRPRTIHSTTGTKDLQMVNISLRILSRPLEEKIPHIYKTVGADFDDRILPSIGNEVLKAVVAQYNAEELLSKREEVSTQIKQLLIERAKSFFLILDDVSITHLTFGREFAMAIESKQVAQQDAERQSYVVMRADQERKANVIRAEGEAEAANLISKAMAAAGNGLIEVRRIDTAKDVAKTLARARNVTYLPKQGGGAGGNSGILLNIPTTP
jgi:prohibitin 1